MALEGIEGEIWVVDNHSTDDSLAYLEPKFPGVHFIANAENLGFAKANNLALAKAQGEYVLFLNPDTLLPEDALARSLAWIKSHSHAGALGFRMLDGKGRFLPESKRAFPTPLAAYYKLTGLAAVFPHSGHFNRYAMGNLSQEQHHVVEVLAGACLLVRKNILDELGGFDERFFMYGEDIDLSYRIRQAGYENHYFPDTPIIHFKGESAVQGGLVTVGYFYTAMSLFVQKHYSKGSAKLFSRILRFAIFLRAAVSAAYKIISPLWLPLADCAILLGCLKGLSLIWINLIREGKDFGLPSLNALITLLTFIFIAVGAIAGLYRRRPASHLLLFPLLAALIGLLAAYALFPESVRFSRAVILFGGACGAMGIWLFRRLLQLLGYYSHPEIGFSIGHTIVVAGENDYAGLWQLLQNALVTEKPLGRVAIREDDTGVLCHVKDIRWLRQTIPFQTIVFCGGEMAVSSIIHALQPLSNRSIRFLFHMQGTGSLIGSDNRKEAGRVLSSLVDYRIAHNSQQKMKRGLDWVVAVLLLLFWPLHFLFHPRPQMLLQNALQVLTGKKTWIGYHASTEDLPALKEAVLSHLTGRVIPGTEMTEIADKLYAKNYVWWHDLLLVAKHYRHLG